MDTRTCVRQHHILLVWLSACLIVGGAGVTSADTSFTGIEPFQGLTIHPGMTAYHSKTFVIHFGEQANEVQYAKPFREQAFDAESFLDVPVYPAFGAAVPPQPVPMNEAGPDPGQIQAIPEPSSLLLLVLGIILVVNRMWGNKNRNERADSRW